MTDTMQPKIVDFIQSSPTGSVLINHFLNNDYLCFAVTDTKGEIVYFNVGAEKLTGYDAQEIVGKNISIFFKNEESVSQVIEGVKATGHRIDPDVKLLSSKGERIFMSASLFRLEDGNGEFVGMFIISFESPKIKLAQETLRARTDFFENLLNSLTDAVLAVDEEGKFIFANQGVKYIFGYEPDEMIGQNVNQFMKEAPVFESPGENFIRTIRQQGSFEGRVQFKNKSGQPFDAAINASAIRSDKGDFFGWVGMVKDITEQVKATQFLTTTNRFLAASSNIGRSLLEGLPLHTMLQRSLDSLIEELDLESGSIHMVTADSEKAVLKVQRNVPNELIKLIQELKIGRDLIETMIAKPRPIKLFEKLSQNSPTKKMLSQIGATGLVTMPLFSKEKMIGFLNVIPKKPFTDLEMSLFQSLGSQFALAIENAMLLKDLRESERKYSVVVERAHDGIIIAQDGVFKFVNKRLADILGYTVSELLNQDIRTVMAPEDVDDILYHYNTRISGIVPAELYQGRLLTKKGKPVEVEFNACTVQFEGRPASLSFVRDISTRLDLQNQIVKQKEVAEFYNDVLTHDINNFCQTMLGNLDTVLMDMPADEDPDRVKKLKTAKASVKKTSHLIDQVRELMHIQTLTDESLMPIRLRDVLSEAIEIAQETFPHKHVHFQNESPKDAFLLGNSLLVLIFLNLFTNAIKHNDKDQAQILIRAESSRLKSRPAWEITVSDNGPGIPEENRKDAFKRFQRFSKRQGQGLGLAIVHALTEKLEGTVEIADMPLLGDLEGLTIRIRLPKA